MPIPKTRPELIELIASSFAKLETELDRANNDLEALLVTDDWTVKDLLAVRLWWTEAVLSWIQAGVRGELPITPAEGYRWSETPRLNADIVASADGVRIETIRRRLQGEVSRVLATIDELSDDELLGVGVFTWADRWPVSRWLSINTARQYTTARTLIRRALREQP